MERVQRVLLVALVLLFPLCFSQECMSACDAGLTTCNTLDYPLLVTNLSVTLQKEQLIKRHLLELKAGGFTDCLSVMKPLLCNVMHTSCNGTIPTPRRPCAQMCTYLNQACGGLIRSFIPAALQPYYNCNMTTSSGETFYDLTNDYRKCSMSVSTTTACPFTETTFQYTGTSQPYNFQPLNLSSAGICAPFVSERVQVPMNWPGIQIIINFLFRAGDYQLRFPKAYPIMPVDCYTHLSALICGSYFQTSVEVDVINFPGQKAWVGQFPCESLCHKTYDVCWDFFVAANLTSLLTNCSVSYPTPDPYIVPVGNGYALSSCRNYVFPENAYSKEFIAPTLEKCPVAFGIKEDVSSTEMKCGLSCPDSSYTTEEWHDLVTVTKVGSSLSLILMFFLIVSYLVQFDKRKFPSAIHFWEFVATAGFAIAFLINGNNPEKDVWCKDPGTSATQSNNSACGAQGFLFIYFGLALAIWCLVIAYVIFYGVVRNRKVSNLAKYTKYFHFVAWGVPLVFAIAALASNSIGYGPPLAWCFIHFEGFGYGDGSISNDYPLFYIPMLAVFVVILVLFIATVSKIIYVRKMNVKSNSNKSRSSRTFQAQIRVLIFILVVFVIIVSIFQWRFEIEAAKSKEEVGLEWAYCKLQIDLDVPTDPNACPGKTNPARIEYSRTVGESFVLSGIGLLIFVGFGADLQIYKHWFKIFRLVVRGEWKQLKDLILLGKDPFASSTTMSKTKTSNSNTSNTSNNSNSNSKNNKSGNSSTSDSNSNSNNNNNNNNNSNNSMYNDSVEYSNGVSVELVTLESENDNVV